jgi:type IX secretion system PorP/SprF family membrane protein
MNRIWFVVLFLLGSVTVLAQQLPQYTQYVLNPLIINPAVSGIENYTDVKAGYRSQWNGLDGAPVTSYFSVTAPLGRNYVNGDVLQVPADGDNPTGPSYVRSYRAAEAHHGIGLTLITDKAGPIRQTFVNVNYAYHLGLTPYLNLAVGVSGGLSNYLLDTKLVTLETPIDNAIFGKNVNQLKPDVGAGLWAYSSNYFVGASVQQLLPQTLNFSGNSAYSSQGKAIPHYYFTGGVKFFLSDDVSLMPSVMFKVVNPAQNTFDINMKMGFRDHFWIGGSYRQTDAVAAMMGFTLDSFLSLGYSYDYTTSALNTVSNGTHEIVIGIYLGNRGGTGPRRGF